MADDDPMFSTWLRWLDHLKSHLQVVHHHRDMWKHVSDRIVEIAKTETPAMPGTWLAHYTRLYVDGTAIALRRLIRSGGRDTITLGKLLESIGDDPGLLCRDAFVARWTVRHEDDDPIWKDEWRRFAGHAYDPWDDARVSLISRGSSGTKLSSTRSRAT